MDETKGDGMLADVLFPSYVAQLEDLYGAESSLIRALTLMAATVIDDDIRQALVQRLEQTRMQLERLQRVFRELKIQPTAEVGPELQELLSQTSELARTVTNTALVDSQLLTVALELGGYLIAAYSTVCTFAQALNEERALRLLMESLDEERSAYKQLRALSESRQYTRVEAFAAR
jgi:ferritin-like metal-binding protein YciE